MNILSIYNTKSGADYHRVYLPMRFFPLKDGDKIIRITELDQLRPSDLSDADIVFYNREQVNDYKTLLKLRDRFGFKIVVDIDDYWELNHKHPHYEYYKKTRTADKWVLNMEEADLVTTTNERLAKKCHEFNCEVKVLPNAIPEIEQFVPEEVDKDKSVFVYTGGGSHVHDVKLLEPSFKKLNKEKEFQSKAGVHYMYPSMKSTFELCGGTLVPPLPLDRYMGLYQGTTCSLAPLTANEFNSCKSNLKVLEAAAMKIPILTSDCHPYLDDESEGIIRCNSQDWYDVMMELTENPEEAKELGEELHKDISEKYNFDLINQKRYNLFYELSII